MTEEARGLRRTFGSLRSPNFRAFFYGQIVSLTGTWMQRLAQDWLILQLTDSALALSIGVALQFAPLLVFGMLGGLVVDRFDKRRLLVWTSIASGLLALVLGVLTLTGTVELWMVYALTFALGCVSVIDQPGRHAFITELVGPEGMANAVSLNSSIFNAARLVGPAVAGLTITAVGIAPTFLVNAASFVAVVISLRLIDPQALYREVPVARAPRQVREGFKYAWHTPALRVPLVLILVVSVFAQNYRIVLPILATEVFAGGAETYGSLLAMQGLGALGGALLCAHFARPTQRLMLLLCAVLGTILIIAAVLPTLALLTGCMILVGASNTSFNTTANTLVQLRSSLPLRGRVIALRGMLTHGAQPLGAPLIGWVCDTRGARVGLAAGGGVALLATLAALRTRRLDSETPEQDTLPGLEPASDPVAP